MKTIAAVLSFVAMPQRRRNLYVLGRMLALLAGLVACYTLAFKALMHYEGQEHSWVTAVYWVLVVMSTLGFGDITFHTDLGRAFSVVVLLSGTLYLLALLPFMFIQFFYVPWMEAQEAARAPRQLPPETAGHVVLTALGPVEASLIRMLRQSRIEYAVIVGELQEALRLHDEGYRVMLGELDDPHTYERVRVGNAALVASLRADTTNTNVAFTVREASERVPIVATASNAASVDILELAGCSRVLQMGEMLGQAFARRVLGRDAKSHVIGRFGDLVIAEAAAAGTPLVGRSLRDIRLRDFAQVSVVGVWERGKFHLAGPETVIHETSVLVLAGSQPQLTAYDSLFCIYKQSDAPVVIIGGGRVGRATGAALLAQGIEFRIVERLPERVRDPQRYVHGDASQLEVLQAAGIMDSSSVVITTHDDDMNVYLTIYCRRLRPDMQILGRANLERNVSTLHRAGADFVMSYASLGANVIYNLLRRTDVLLLAEGLDVFRLPTPSSLVGKSLAECRFRQTSGCHVVAVVRNGQFDITPDPNQPLDPRGELVIIGDAESERRFLDRWGGD